MPENQFGMLIDPEGKAVESIDADEYSNLRTCLEALQVDAWKNNLMHILLDSMKDPEQSKTALISIVLGDFIDNHNLAEMGCAPHPFYDGMLGTRHNEVALLKENELPVLMATLATIRAGGWFADWLAERVLAISAGTTPAEQHPTPREIVLSLSGELKRFEGEMAIVDDFVKERPDFFAEQQLDALIAAAVGEKDASEIAARVRQVREKAKKDLQTKGATRV